LRDRTRSPDLQRSGGCHDGEIARAVAQLGEAPAALRPKGREPGLDQNFVGGKARRQHGDEEIPRRDQTDPVRSNGREFGIKGQRQHGELGR
jgi:hypothetical protein